MKFSFQSAPHFAMHFVLAVVVSLSIQAFASAQTKSDSNFALKNLVKAKFAKTEEGPSIAFTIAGSRTETRVRMVPITRMRTETRTRTRTVEGKPVAETYTVQVPYTEMVSQSYSVVVPGGKTQKFVKLDDISFYKLDGSIPEKDEVKKLLENESPILLLKTDPSKAKIKPASDYLRKALHPNLLLAVTNAFPAKTTKKKK